MNFVVDKLSFLGLNEKEIKVFTAISTFGCMNMTKISSHSGLSRTTVDAIVRRLLKRKLIFKKKIGKHYEYFVDLNKVADSLAWIEKRLRLKKVDEKREVSVCSTEDTLKNICDVHSGDRLRLLLSIVGEDIEDVVNRFVSYSNVVVANNMNFEVLVCSAVADALRENKSKMHFLNDVSSFILNIVPSVYCDYVGDIFIFRDKVLLVNPLNNNIEHIEHEKIVELNKHLVTIACETGWSVSLKAWFGD